MQINFDCPKCLTIARDEVSAQTQQVKCSNCQWTRPIAAEDRTGETPTRCLVCGCNDLWRQKDLGVFDNEFRASVPRHGVVLVRISGVK